MNTYLYKLDGAVYVNLTNRCTNDCTFCVKNMHDGVGGYNLLLDKEPDANDIIEALSKEENVQSVVFCGFGEPTLRIDVLLEAARYLKGRGAHIRINTNGQGSAFAGYDIAPSMRGLIDTISISLNAPSAKEYQELCQSVYGEQAYTHVLEFAKSCIAQGIETVLTVVDVIGKEKIEQCKQIAQRTGAKFRLRQYLN